MLYSGNSKQYIHLIFSPLKYVYNKRKTCIIIAFPLQENLLQFVDNDKLVSSQQIDLQYNICITISVRILFIVVNLILYYILSFVSAMMLTIEKYVSLIVPSNQSRAGGRADVSRIVLMIDDPFTNIYNYYYERFRHCLHSDYANIGFD